MPTAVRMSEARAATWSRISSARTRVIYAEPAQTYFPEALRRERAGLLRHGELIVMPGSHHLHMDDAPGVAAAIGDFFHAS
jgi:pimeloyl-ACP methyl ester carboxylesterase